MADEFIYDREFFEEFGIDPKEIIEILQSYDIFKDIMDKNPVRARALMVLKQNQMDGFLSSV